jgi:octaprenyl-diphosphate synthase
MTWSTNLPCVGAGRRPIRAFGNPASVLVGDFLYSRAFQMMVDVGDMRIMQILANATNVIAEGEVLQLMNMHDASLDESGYLKVIRSKTAKLFEASAQLGAVLAQTGPAMEQCLRNMDRHWARPSR